MAQLGIVPENSTLNVTRGADWYITLMGDTPWPEGINWFITFPGKQKSYIGKMDAPNNQVHFRIEEKETTEEHLPNGERFRLYYQIPGDPTTETCLYRGKVRRYD